jgi:hypothetical protein
MPQPSFFQHQFEIWGAFRQTQVEGNPVIAGMDDDIPWAPSLFLPVPGVTAKFLDGVTDVVGIPHCAMNLDRVSQESLTVLWSQRVYRLAQLLSRLLEVHTVLSQDLGGKTAFFAQQPKQQVLGPNVAMA